MRIVNAKKKEEKQRLKARKEKAKTWSTWNKEAQYEFNRYIRLRDRGLPCICCSRYGIANGLGGVFDAGHYRSRGAARHLRFDERNCHAQLKHCNRYAFDSTAFRAGLVAKVGESAVLALEQDNSSKKYTIDDLRQIKETYRAKAKELESKE